MSSSPIRWYSINREERIEEHERIDLDEAIKIVDGYITSAGMIHKSTEDAVAASMFGFYRSKTDFIEICINGPAQIAYRFEMLDLHASWFRRLFNKVFQYEEILDSRKALVAKVKEFFTTPVEEIKLKLKRRWLW